MGQVVRLVGEAGIGKTTVVSEMAAKAAEVGLEVWWANAAELDASTPYGVMASTRSTQTDERVFGSDVVRTVSPTPQERPTPEAERFGIVENIVETVESRTQSPTLFIVEDVHWADPASLDALAVIARIALTHPLVLVLTMRRTTGDDALGDMNRRLDAAGGAAITVPPLSPPEIDDLVDRLCGGNASDVLRSRAYGAAGNPFLVHELVDGLLAEGRLGGTGELHDLPVQLRDAVGRELSRLGDTAMTVVRAASVQGNAVDVHDLAGQLVQSVVQLSAPIEAAIGAGLLVERDNSLRFRHDLVRDAAYQQMPAVVRAGAHRDLATVLARRSASPALVASHLLLAGGDQPETVERLQAAASQTAPLVPNSALEFLDRALDLVMNDVDTRRVIERARLEALTAAGRLAEAEGVAHWLTTVSPPDDQSDLLARLAGLALIAGNGERSIEYGRRAIEHAGDDAQRARFIGIAAVTTATNRDYIGAWKLAHQAIDLGESSGSPVGHSIGLALVARMSAYAAAIEDGLRLGAQAVAIADTDETGEAHSWVPCLHYGMTAYDADELILAEQMIARGNELATTHRMQWARALYGALQAACHLRRGDLDLAAAEAEAAVDQAIRMNSHQCLTWAQAMLALVSLEIGSVAEARTWLDAADESWATGKPSMGVDTLALAHARVLLAEDRPAEAYAALCADWDRFELEGITFCHPLLATDLAEMALANGDDARFDIAVRALENAGRSSRVHFTIASALWLEATRRRSTEEARASLERMRPTGRRYELARRLATEADLLAGDGDPAEPLGEALAIFEQIGAVRSAAEVRERLGELGASVGDGCTPWSSLTPTELEIVRLLAEGSTNAQIAHLRGSSRRTVESHLSRVYQKLAIEGRVKLTVVAAEHFNR